MSMSRAACRTRAAACRRCCVCSMARRRAPPFAPPFLKAGELLIGQTANILLYLGAHHGLAPSDEAGRLLGQPAAAHHRRFRGRGARHAPSDRERALLRGPAHGGAPPAAAFSRTGCRNFSAISSACSRAIRRRRISSARRELCRPVAVPGRRGLRYAFPRAMARLEKNASARLRADTTRSGAAAHRRLPGLDRRIPFNEQGIFRHYDELDAAP